MAYSEAQKYWIWLASVYGLGARRFDAIVGACGGSPQQVWEEIGPWMEPIIGRQAYTALQKARNAAYFDRLFEMTAKCGAVAITREDSEYPSVLRTVVDAPPVLFVRGRVAQDDRRTLAIVGARNSTAYGTRMARRIARDLSLAGVTVISGLARGVDSAAHRGAIDAAARTVAVLGSGVDVIYPPEHRMLSEEILERGGSIVSELVPGSPPSAWHFPARNRIISGLSNGLLLVEATQHSGAMTTVTFALEQSRTVFALPGQADSPLSRSTHALIREGATLVTSAAEIYQDMAKEWGAMGQASTQKAHRTAPVLPLTQAEQRIYNALAGGAADPDMLVEMTNLPPPELNSLLTIMELQGLIRKLPGRRVERYEAEL